MESKERIAELLEIAREAQTEYWDAMNQLEKALGGVEIDDSTRIWQSADQLIASVKDEEEE